MSSSVILAALVFAISCAETDKQTRRSKPIQHGLSASIVGVDN